MERRRAASALPQSPAEKSEKSEPLALPVASDRAWVSTFGQLCRSPLG